MVVTQAPNRDRFHSCRSCRARATRIILIDGKPWNSTCERHAALNLERAKEAATKEN